MVDPHPGSLYTIKGGGLATRVYTILCLAALHSFTNIPTSLCSRILFQQVMSPEPPLLNKPPIPHNQKPMSDKADSAEDLFKHKEATFPRLNSNYSTWSNCKHLLQAIDVWSIVSAKSFRLQIPVLPEIWRTSSAHTKKNSKITTSATTEPQKSSTTLFQQTLVLTLIQPKIHLRRGPFSDSQMEPTSGALSPISSHAC